MKSFEPIYFAPTPKLGGGWIAWKDSPSPPAAPDYAGAAVAQGAANKESAIASAQLSNPNIYSPYGNQTVSYSVDPTTGNPVPTINQSLNPQSQSIFGKQQNVREGLADISGQALGTAQGVLRTPFSFGGPGVQTGLDTSGVARMPVNAGTTGQDAIMSRLEPALARQRTSLETQLTNQGLRPGSEAWDNGMKDFSQQANDQRTQAAMQGINLDMSANNQGFNQSLQAGQFGNTAQQQALAQAISQRQMPLNEISALMSGSQIQNPQFQPYTGQTVQASPIMAGTQAQGNAGLQQYGIQQAGANANTQGLYSLGGAGMMALAMSDRRLKSHIERIGTHPRGFGVYEYKIADRYEIGAMADEVEKVIPEAVITTPSGYKAVNYALL